MPHENLYSSEIAGEKETMPYFAAHFEQQLERYKKQVGLLCQKLFA